MRPAAAASPPAKSRRLYRSHQLLGSPKRGITPLVPIGRSTLNDWVAAGFFPAPIRLGSLLVWDADAVDEWVAARLTGGGDQTPADIRAAELRAEANRKRSARMKAFQAKKRAARDLERVKTPLPPGMPFA
jgi:predicted DNA-binding transcriptional regulator AlpA